MLAKQKKHNEKRHILTSLTNRKNGEPVLSVLRIAYCVLHAFGTTEISGGKIVVWNFYIDTITNCACIEFSQLPQYGWVVNKLKSADKMFATNIDWRWINDLYCVLGNYRYNSNYKNYNSLFIIFLFVLKSIICKKNRKYFYCEKWFTLKANSVLVKCYDGLLVLLKISQNFIFNFNQRIKNILFVLHI